MPSRLSTQLRDVIAAAMNVQAFVTLVELTPSLDMKAALDDPDVTKTLETILAEHADGDVEQAVRNAKDRLTAVNDHLARAGEEASTWRRELLPKMFEIDRDVAAYGSQITAVTESVTTTLSQLVPTMTTAQLEQALARTGGLLSGLAGAIETRVTDIGTLEVSLKTLSDNMNETAGKFETDKEAIDQLLSSERGVIAAVQTQIDGLNSDITRDIGLIAGGSAGIIVGIGLIVGGVLVGTGTFGGGTGVAVGLVVAGVIVLGGSIAGVAVSGVDLPKVRDKLAESMKDLALLHQLVLFFSSARTHVKSLAEHMQAGADGVIALKGFWDSEQSDLRELETTVKQAQDAVAAGQSTFADVQAVLQSVVGQLGTAQIEWKEAAEDASFLDDALKGVETNVDTSLLPQAAAA